MAVKHATVEVGKPPKKFKAVVHFEDGRHCTVPFGQVSPADPLNDFPHHRDPARRADYLRRHRASENWQDPCSAGFWSRWMLWEHETPKGIADVLRTKLHAPVRFAPGVAEQLQRPYR